MVGRTPTHVKELADSATAAQRRQFIAAVATKPEVAVAAPSPTIAKKKVVAAAPKAPKVKAPSVLKPQDAPALVDPTKKPKPTKEEREAYQAKKKAEAATRPKPTQEERAARKAEKKERKKLRAPKPGDKQPPRKKDRADRPVFGVKMDCGPASSGIGRKKFHSDHKDISMKTIPGLLKWVKYGMTPFVYFAFAEAEKAIAGAKAILALKAFTNWKVVGALTKTMPCVEWNEFSQPKRNRKDPAVGEESVAKRRKT